jgi:very-short-patch-repair endonuclease
LEAPEITGKSFDSEFEVSVADMLINKGYEIVPQLGVAGFFIDLAVRHPTRPGDFLACIECDGATYHSGLSVRDRDRLRQEVLERLGWDGKIYRIWSTDWFKDPKRQLEKLLGFLEKLKGLTPPLAVVEEIPEVWEQAKLIVTGGLEVEVGDFVSYCFVDNEAQEIGVQIIAGQSNPGEGLINQNTPLAKALVGLCVGDEEEVKLPLGEKTLRVLDIQR